MLLFLNSHVNTYANDSFNQQKQVYLMIVFLYRDWKSVQDRVIRDNNYTYDEIKPHDEVTCEVRILLSYQARNSYLVLVQLWHRSGPVLSLISLPLGIIHI